MELLDAGHMLGSAQVVATYSDGYRVGYSGDFSWPLSSVAQVDELVVDAAYGSDKAVRRFSRDKAESDFLELVTERLLRGPVVVKAHRGTLHRAAILLFGSVRNPIVVSEKVAQELQVYAGYGLATDVCTEPNVSSGAYVKLIGHREAIESQVVGRATVVTLTGFRMRSEPIQYISDRGYNVCLSDHADYEETLLYVERSGAKRIRVDNTRHGNGVELALGISERLGLEVRYDIAEEDPY
ncbi:hypothetical protein [Geodermatophilus normandii]|uniref:hypothetical protein n=1 Tax=Geodermatophilus normandii TaxID=1137989 RepID=UPI0011B500EB|nr:hypothetical protein [Geodermatophilus normandii]